MSTLSGSLLLVHMELPTVQWAGAAYNTKGIMISYIIISFEAPPVSLLVLFAHQLS
jgi:hypothetical protein